MSPERILAVDRSGRRSRAEEFIRVAGVRDGELVDRAHRPARSARAGGTTDPLEAIEGRIWRVRGRSV